MYEHVSAYPKLVQVWPVTQVCLRRVAHRH